MMAGGLGTSLSGLGQLIGVAGAAYFAVSKLTEAVRAGVAEWAAQEQALAQVAQAIANSGGRLQKSAEEWADYAQGLQMTVAVADDLVLSAVSILGAFELTDAEIERAVPLAADLAARLGTDLSSAAKMLGKALQDPDEGISALQRSLRFLSEEQREAVKYMVAHGREAEAQAVILGELETAVGGSAEAARDTFSGAMKTAELALADLQKEIGEQVVPQLRALVEGFASSEAESANLRDSLVPAFQAIGAVIAAALLPLKLWSAAFNEIRGAAAVVQQSVLDALSLIVSGLIKVGEAASKLPGVGEKYAAATDVMRGVKQSLDDLAGGFAEVAAEQFAMGAAAEEAGKKQREAVDPAIIARYAALADAEKEAAKSAKEAAAEVKQAFDAFQSVAAKLDPLEALQQQVGKDLEAIMKAVRLGVVSAAEGLSKLQALQNKYRASLMELDPAPLEIGIEIDDGIAEEWARVQAELRAEVGKDFEVPFFDIDEIEAEAKEIQQKLLEESAKYWDAWERSALAVADSIGMLGQAMGRFNARLGQAIEGTAALAANLIQAYAAWKKAGSQQGYSAEGVMGGMAIGGQVGGMGQSFGWWKGDRGNSNFGGKMSGDYGDTGATVGGIIGSFFGPIGALVGGLIGGVLGGLIKKGADEGLGELRKTLTGVALTVTKSEGGLGDVLAKVGTAIDETLRGLLEHLGGTLESIPDVSFKIRDNTVSVWVGAVHGIFKDLQEATAFAVQEILRQGEISGLGENVKKVLQGSFGKSLEKLSEELEFAQYMDNLGLDEVALRIREELAGFRIAMQKAAELGLGTDSLVAQFGKNLGAIRDQILGISETEEERIQRQSEAFNAEVVLLRAEQQMRLADLQLQEADLQAKLAVLKAEGNLSQAELEIAQGRVESHIRMLDAEAGILQAELEISNGKFSLLEATLYQLSVVQGAIDAAGELLGNLPDLISPEDIAAAINRGRGGGGDVGGDLADVGASLEDVRGELDAIARGLLPELARQVAEINLRYDELLVRAREVGIAEEEIFDLRRRELAKLRQETESTLLGYIADAGTDPMINPISLALDEIERWRQSLIDSADELGLNIDLINAAADARRKMLADETRGRVADFADPHGIGGAAKLAADAERLRNEIRNLGLSAEETARLLAQVDLGETLRKKMAINDVLGQLYQYLADSPEYAEQVAAFKRMEFDLQMEIIRQQLIAYGVWEQYAQTWSDAVAAGAKALENAADDVGSSGWGGGGGGGGTYEDMVADLRRRLREYLNLGIPDGFVREMAELQQTFQELYNEAGRLGVPLNEVTEAFEAATRDLMNRVLEPIRALQQELFSGPNALESPEARLARLQGAAAAEFQAAMGGDLDAYQRFADLARQLMEGATGAFGGGVGSAYYRDMIAAWLAQLESAGVALGAGPVTNPSAPWLTGRDTPGTARENGIGQAMAPVVSETARFRTQAHTDAQEIRQAVEGMALEVLALREEVRLQGMRPEAVN